MKVDMELKTVKIWFSGISISRNIPNVKTITHDTDRNLMTLDTNQGEILIFTNNVNLIEVL